MSKQDSNRIQARILCGGNAILQVQKLGPESELIDLPKERGKDCISLQVLSSSTVCPNQIIIFRV